MSTTLPITETYAPTTAQELCDTLRAAHDSTTPVYPCGGSTVLGYGLPVKQPGWNVSLADMNQLIDYPARDMTVTVEAGMTMAALAEHLAGERQRLPIDAPDAEVATIGGLIATNFSGPRRFGSGTLRDYVIGISAVDGRGVLFKGGGRVVKNVAGYDFCKLLTGSLGTLAVIQQVTLKVRPLPESTALLACEVESLAKADALLASLGHSQVTPMAIELLAGPAWGFEPGQGAAQLVVGLEGTEPEVAWMIGQLRNEWNTQGVYEISVVEQATAAGLWQRLTDFSALDDSPLVVKLTALPSRECELIGTLQQLDPHVSIQAHAGNGVVIAQFQDLSTLGTVNALVKHLHPAAIAAGGSAVVWSSANPEELTRAAVWGPVREESPVMQSVKRQFDPRGILNPGRFVV